MAGSLPSPQDAEKALELANLVLAFGTVLRTLHHPDLSSQETDTTHTVMLGILGCAVAERFAPRLDRGRVAEFALVHDLVEAYAGDTNSLAMPDGAKKDKEDREAAALARIKGEFDAAFPWIGSAIEEYESLASPEARFVKVLDKSLPKLVHALNGGHTVKGLGETRESVKGFHERQLAALAAGYGSDQPEAMEFLRLSMEIADAVLADMESA